MKGKKLISVFTCSFLLLGGGTLLAVQSASKNAARLVRADVEPNASYDHIYDDNDNYNNTQFTTGYNQVLIVYSGTAHGLSGESATITSPETLAMISINDTPLTSLAVVAWEGLLWFRIVYPNTVAAGDVMEVQTGLTIGDAIFEGFKLQLNENLKWENNLGTFTFTEANLDSAATYMYGINTTENEAPGGWDTTAFAPVDNDSGVFVDGTRVGTEIKKLNATTYFIAVPGGDVGTTATVKGKWANSQYSFSVNEFTRTWDGTRWIIESVDVGPISFVGVESGAASSVSFIASEANAIPNNWADVYKPTSSGAAFLGETDITSSIKCKKPGVKGYFFEGFTADKDDILTLSGTWTGYSGGRSYTFTINNFSRKWNGEAWDYIDVNVGDVTLNGLSGDGPSNDHQLTLHATLPNDAPTSWTKGFEIESGDVRKNGVPLEGIVCKKVGQQGYFFDGFSVTTNDILKFDATFARVEGDYRYHFHILEYSIQYHGEEAGWGLVDVILPEIVFEEALATSTKNAVYFYTQIENLLDPDWSRIYPDAPEQVKLNGVDITEDHYLQKTAPHDYYLDIKQDANAGDVLEISGSWTIDLGDYSYHFTVKEFALKYNGTVWQSLDQYKAAAKAELDSYLSEDDYLPADWDTAEQWIVNYKESIDLCTTFADIDEQLEGAETNLDSIPTKTERAQQAAAQVDALINEIIDINRRTYEGEKPKVVAARNAYDALSEEAKGYVTKLDSLERAEARVLDVEAAIAVDELIDAIGEVTLEKEQQILDARAAYDALTDAQSIYVLDLDVLVAAEDRLAELKELAAYKTQVLQALQQELQQILPNYRTEQQQQIQTLALQAQTAIQNAGTKDAVDTVVAQARAQLAEIPTKNQLDAKDVDDQIAALPAVADIALTDEDAIVAARAAYEALNSDAKALVTKLEVLQAAEARLAALKDAKAEAAAFDALVEAIGEVTVANNATCQKLVAALNAYGELSDDAYAMITKEAELASAYQTYCTLLRAAMAEAAERVNEIYDALNMKKYTAENRELLAQIKQEALDLINDAISDTSLGSIEYLDAVLEAYQEAINEVPQKKAPAKKGCGGSIVATSIVLSTLALAGLGLAISKKRKED